MQSLLDSQRNAIEKLSQFKVGALFMEPGTGKTRAALELVRSVPECDYVLWLTPFQTKQNLRDELDKWGNSGIRIEGIESLSSSDRLYLELHNQLNSARNPFIVVDESLKVKNWEAIRTQRIIELGKLAQYKLILNGTPVSRNLLDLWAQVEFLSPLILKMDLAEFKRTFCEFTRITKRIGKREQMKEFITKYHNVEYLYSVIRHYVFEAQLELMVNKQFIEWKYDLSADEIKEYNELKVKYLDNEMMQWKNNNIFLELTNKMQHGYCCSKEKFDLLQHVIDAHGIDSVMVFTKYIISREEVVKRYPNMRVLSYQKEAFGLNLQEYSVTVFFDKIWDYALRIQAEDRTYRTGQSKNCIYYDFTGDVGLEKLIKHNVASKHDMLEYFKKHSVEQIKNEL